MTQFFYLDPVTGAGKTYGVTTYAADRLSAGFKFAVAQPTKLLAARSYSAAISRYPELADQIKLITSDTHPSGVAEEIGDYTNNIGSGGALLFLTQTALQQAEHWFKRDNWHVICDEPLNVPYHRYLKLAKHRKLIENLFKPVREVGDYTEIEPLDRRSLVTELGYLDRDDFVKLLGDVYQKLASPLWRVYVRTERFAKFVKRKEDGFDVFGMLSPDVFDGFASTTLIAANLRKSVMYRYFETLGCAFKEHKAIAKTLRYRVHTNGHRLHVKYFSEREWSKNLRDTWVTDNGRQFTIGDAYRDEIEKAFPDGDYLVLKNADVDGIYFKGRALPNDPRGLNDFMQCDKIAIYSALNPCPAHRKFLEDMTRMTPRELRRSMLSEVAYQALGRGTLRDPDATCPMTLLVPDRATADDIAVMYPGCHVAPLIGGDVVPDAKFSGRPTRFEVAMTGAERMALMRQNRKDFAAWKTDMAQQISDLNFVAETGRIPDESGDVTNPYYNYRALHEKKTKENSSPMLGGVRPNPAPGFTLSLFHTYRDKLGNLQWDSHPFETHAFISTPDLISMFTVAQTRVIAKEDNDLFSPSLFDEQASWHADPVDTKRGLKNVIAARGIWLDFDDSEITPQQAANVLQELECVVYSSASSRHDNNRFRVGIPSTELMTDQAYRNITAQLIARFAEHGYLNKKQLKTRKGKNHGIDGGKLHAASLFFLPAQAEHNFLLHYEGADRAPLNPTEWIAKSTIMPDDLDGQPTIAAPAPKPPLQIASEGRTGQASQIPDAIQRAIDKWQTEALQPGNGHSQFFALACALARAGCGATQLAEILQEQSYFARHPEQRQAEIKNLLNSPTVRGYLLHFA